MMFVHLTTHIKSKRWELCKTKDFLSHRKMGGMFFFVARMISAKNKYKLLTGITETRVEGTTRVEPFV